MSAREQLMETAGRLFYDRGIAATGVDAVARESGVSKPTLYAHFGSKAELVAAVLDARHARRAEELTEWVMREPDPRRRPLAVFAWLHDFYGREGDRGCAFLNAAAEGEARSSVREEKDWLQALLTDLAREAGAPDPERLGSQLLLLIDGVSGRVVVQGRAAAPRAIADAERAARALLG